MAVEPLRYTCWDSPLGPIFILASRQGLCRIAINQPVSDEWLKQLEVEYQCPIIADEQALEGPLKALQDYFQGKRRRFVNLPLDLRMATSFQKSVWRILKQIPYGRVRSYQWVARKLEHPQAARAVGAANRQNPLPIVIPCHRVVKADGGVGGYRGGVDIKRALLELEGVKLV